MLPGLTPLAVSELTLQPAAMPQDVAPQTAPLGSGRGSRRTPEHSMGSLVCTESTVPGTAAGLTAMFDHAYANHRATADAAKQEAFLGV